MRCTGLHKVANSPYLSQFQFSAFPCVAPYCVPGGIRVVSEAGRYHLSDTFAIEVRKRSLGDSVAGAFRHGDGSIGGLVVPFLATTASSSARSLPLLCGPPVLECPLPFSTELRGGAASLEGASPIDPCSPPALCGG